MDTLLPVDETRVEDIVASEARWLAAGLEAGPHRLREVVADALRIEHDVERWLGDRPFDRRRVLPTCLLVAATAPGASRLTRLVTAAVGLWTAMIDDCFDDGRMSRDELVAQMARCDAAARGALSADDAPDLSSWAIADVRARIAPSPLFDALSDAWAEAVHATMVGMAFEFDWRADFAARGAIALPDLETYVANGGDSIGKAAVCWAGFIAEGHPALLAERDALSEVIRLSGRAFRLANDMRSDAKEREEGTINALTLFEAAHRARGVPPEQAGRLAFESVAAAIDRELEMLRAAEAALQDDGPMMGFTGACVRLLVQFYGQRDFLPRSDAFPLAMPNG